MDDVEFVNVFDSIGNLLEELGSFDLLDPLLSNDIIKKLTTASELGDQIQFCFVLDDFVQLDDTGMA